VTKKEQEAMKLKLRVAEEEVYNLRFHLRSVIVENDRLKDQIEKDKKKTNRDVVKRVETWVLLEEVLGREKSK
jgi:hypothetical protein